MAHLIHMSSIILQSNSWAHRCIDSSWQEFKNSIMAEIRLFHSRPFMKKDLHSLIIVKLVTFQMPIQLQKLVRATFTSTTDALPNHVIIIMEIQSINFKICTIF